MTKNTASGLYIKSLTANIKLDESDSTKANYGSGFII